MRGASAPEWDSEMVCSDCGLSYMSTRYVEVEPERRIRLCPECHAEVLAEQEAAKQ